MLLQLLDDGRLTDCQGRTVDFKNTVVIMTSNLGSTTLIEAAEAGAPRRSRARRVGAPAAARPLPAGVPQPARRIIVFEPLGEAQLRQIAGLLIANVERRLAESDIHLEVTDAALTLLAREGYDPVYGARPLRRAIQRHLENPLARRILAGEIHAGDTARIDVNADGELTFNGSVEPGPQRRASVAAPGGGSSIH